MPKPRVARRILSAILLVLVLALALDAPDPASGPRADRGAPAVEASPGTHPSGTGGETVARGAVGADGAAADAGPQVAANAGDPLAKAILAIDASGGFTLQETVSQIFAGTPPSEAQVALVYDARGERGPAVMAWGLAAVSDSPVAEPVRLFAEGGTLYYDSGDGWQAAPYADLADVFAALGLYDDWGWFADAYRAGKVKPVLASEAGAASPEVGAAPSEGGVYTLEIDRGWLAEQIAAQGLGIAPVQAVYRVSVGRAQNGPELRAEGDLVFELGSDRLTVASKVVVRSVLGLPPVEVPPELAGGGSR